MKESCVYDFDITVIRAVLRCRESFLFSKEVLHSGEIGDKGIYSEMSILCNYAIPIMEKAL